jgi:hypothetical protein
MTRQTSLFSLCRSRPLADRVIHDMENPPQLGYLDFIENEPKDEGRTLTV